MRQHAGLLLVALIAVVGLTGCAKARFIETSPGCGVVAIPANTNTWPNYYRDQAEALIRQKCPNGYEIVGEGEAVTGQVAHTDSHTESRPPPTLSFGGEADSGKKGDRSASFAGLAIPLGKTQETTNQTTQYSNVTEWRISYRAK
jgi:hypothetical protein